MSAIQEPRHVPPTGWLAWHRASLDVIRRRPVAWCLVVTVDLAAGVVFALGSFGMRPAIALLSLSCPVIAMGVCLLELEGDVSKRGPKYWLVEAPFQLLRQWLSWFLSSFILVVVTLIVIRIVLAILLPPPAILPGDVPQFEVSGVDYDVSLLLIHGVGVNVMIFSLALVATPFVFFSLPVFGCHPASLMEAGQLVWQGAFRNRRLMLAISSSGIVMLLVNMLLSALHPLLVLVNIPVRVWLAGVMLAAYRDVFLGQPPHREGRRTMLRRPSEVPA